ncbi:AMP-binding protein [Streptomyces spinosirectus]|uniref:class I adenylate-forming enzyme family protein n=1 Tax=Streptomyces TaxID=1883 RepID=UPI000FFEC1B0|nr:MULTISPECIES: AMP-binding protein [Streptomyces]MBY8345148.1 AMP-binding protein [Streptomyces plumbidurans]UIR18098.1 AMP-binding protein [Streptomyces spinosirectus]
MTTQTLVAADTVDGLLAAAVAARPDAPAVRDVAGSWTYAELDAWSRAYADWFTARGVGRGDRVLARVGNVREFTALLFGALRRGIVFVPVNPAMKRFHLSTVVPDCEPVMLIAQRAEDVELLRELTDRPVVPLAHARAGAEQQFGGGVHEDVAVDPDDLGLLIYTSGSTSAPKAVASPHAPIVFAARAIQARLKYREDDVVLAAVPLSFDYGLYQIFLSVIAGAQLVLTEPDRHVRLLGALHEYGVTVVPLVPSLAEMLLTLARRDRREPPPVRLFTNTGAALTAPVIARLRKCFPQAQVSPMFGTTECKRITVLEPDGDLEKPGSVGRALDGTEVLVLDDEGRPLPPGTVGEIAVRGPHMMRGYWRAPEQTALRFRPDPVTGEVTLHTGDYGHLDADGHLYFEGRRDDLFKRKGVRMGTLEIETAALDIPGVAAAAALAPADGHDLTLYAVTDLTPAAVLAQLAERLEAAKVPAACHLLDALPLTPNGKTDKQRLRREQNAGQVRPD